MTDLQIPSDGVTARMSFEMPAPGDLPTIGGVRVYLVFGQYNPSVLYPRLMVGGASYDLSQSAGGPMSKTFVAQFPVSLDAPQQAELLINEGVTLQAGTTITAYAWGAQTESGTGALNPDEGGEPSTITETIELGTVTVLPWLEWNRLTGANEGLEGGS